MRTYLRVVVAGMVGFGLAIVVAPTPALEGFGRMVYGTGGLPADFSPEARGYIQLTQAVMGSVIVGWFVLVAWVVRSPLALGVPGAWPALVASLLAWFVPDTAYSLLSGYWPNAVLNVVLLLALAPGVLSSRPTRSCAPAA